MDKLVHNFFIISYGLLFHSLINSRLKHILCVELALIID